MEITELNLIGDFEAGMKCLQNPSLFSKLSPLSSIDKVPQLFSFWKWSALILAFFATFTSLITRIKLFLYRIHFRSLFSRQQICADQIFDDEDFDFDFSDDDDDDDTPSSVAESDDEEFDSEDNEKPVYEVFRADGNSTLRRRNGFSWSDFSAGKSVVQLWDSFGLGLDFEDEDESEYESEIAIWNLNRDVKLTSGRQRQVAGTAANVVLTAEMEDDDDNVGLGPAIYAAWRPRQEKVFY